MNTRAQWYYDAHLNLRYGSTHYVRLRTAKKQFRMYMNRLRKEHRRLRDFAVMRGSRFFVPRNRIR